MENNELMNLHVRNLYDALRDTFYMSNIGFSAVRLIFLKYVSDNYIGAYTREEMSAYGRVTRLLATDAVNASIDTLEAALNVVDKHYNLGGLITNTVYDYGTDLFGFDEERQRRVASQADFKKIFSALSKMDLADDTAFTKGKMLVSALVSNLYRYMAGRFTAPHISRSELCTLAKNILQIKDDEVFLDFAAGIGATTTAITRDSGCKILHYDIDRKVLPIAAMLYIMNGAADFSFAQKDFSELVTNEQNNDASVADKIFVDLSLPQGSSISQREARIDATETAIHLLKENGKAIITTTFGSLSSGTAQAIKARGALLNTGYISHVVSLPISWASTNATINLIIVSKAKNDKILFVNADTNAFKEYVGGQGERVARYSPPISEKGLTLLADVINNNKEVPSLSKLVPLSQIASNDFNLAPVTYIADVELMTSSIDEIDEELTALYRALSSLL